MHLRAKQAYLGEYKTLPVCSVFNVEKRSDQNVRSGKGIRCLGPIVGFSPMIIIAANNNKFGLYATIRHCYVVYQGLLACERTDQYG